MNEELFTPSPYAPKQPSGNTCWNCGGTGVAGEGPDATPCGACFGIMIPAPCPVCGSRRIKICLYDFSYVVWRCRDCKNRGPESRMDLDALLEWQKQAGVPNLPTLRELEDRRNEFVRASKALPQTEKDRLLHPNFLKWAQKYITAKENS